MPSKGDISRDLFDPAKGYTSVRSQQGRVSLDADRNENTDIVIHDARAARADLIGAHGGPQGDAGLELRVSGNALQISTGRYYVDGLRVELRSAVGGDEIEFDDQPFATAVEGGPEVPGANGWYLAYVEAWERSVTAIEDPNIREIALGGPDTTTREQLVWQVRLLPISPASTPPACADSLPEWDALEAASTATLAVQTVPDTSGAGPCVVPEGAGYRGLENQLYRFEVHGVAPVVIKWSRENASVVARLSEATDGSDRIRVERLGPGGTRGFAVGDWVELSDGGHELAGRSGELFTILEVETDLLVLDRAVDSTHGFGEGARVTRWDGVSTDAPADTWIDVEHGVQFARAGAPAIGDYWLAPVRAAVDWMRSGQELDWPRDGAGAVALAPFGPARHRARLAILRRSGGVWERIHDCRRLFPSLGEVLDFAVFGGDGQFACSGHWLPRPLAVSLMRGGQPVANELVEFAVTEGGGKVSDAAPQPSGAADLGAVTGTSIQVSTDARGVAWAWWQTGAVDETDLLGDRYRPEDGQELVATLRMAGAATDHRVRFVAHTQGERRLDYYGGDGQTGLPGQTLKIALRVQVCQGSRPVAGARVRYVVENRMHDGAKLDAWKGGALHPSFNAVSDLAVRWPGAKQLMEAVVETDAHGVAQLQWRLGTELGLPTQRVEAILLDDDDAPTSQRVLFTAQLDLAQVMQRWVVQQGLGLPPAFARPAKTPLTPAEVIKGARVRLSYGVAKDWDKVERGATVRVKPGARFKFSLPFAIDLASEDLPRDLVRLEVVQSNHLLVVPTTATLSSEGANQIDVALPGVTKLLGTKKKGGYRARMRLILSELYPPDACMRVVESAVSFTLVVPELPTP